MGFLAWIKNGTKGTYGLQMPAFFPASRTTYDPTTSGLSATRVQGAIDAVEGQIANSSDAYSSSKAYAVGDYCIYNDTLYRCVTACSAASWSVNSSCFTADTVVGAINEGLQLVRITPTFTIAPMRYQCYKYGRLCYFSAYFPASTVDHTITMPPEVRNSAEYTDLVPVMSSGTSLVRTSLERNGEIKITAHNGAISLMYIWAII